MFVSASLLLFAASLRNYYYDSVHLHHTLLYLTMADGALIGFIAAAIVCALVIAVICVWRYYKRSERNEADVERETREKTMDGGVEMGGIDAANDNPITASAVNREIQAEKDHIDAQAEGGDFRSESNRKYIRDALADR